MKYFSSICVLALGIASAGAATIQIDYSAAPGERAVQIVTTAVTSALPSGNKVAVGTFDTAGGFDVAANAGSISALASRWIEFDSKSIRTIGGEDGRFSESGSGDDAGFVGKPIYLWIFKTATNVDPQVDFSDPVALNAPAADFSDITGYGLYNAPSWTFPDGANPAPANLALITSDDAGLVALNGGVIGPATTGSLTLIPEPSTTSLAGLTVMICALRRRRR
ncbi:MAG: hypothetical protein KDN22_12790 [Verrucomicrobiae bacterium]|nr:hypothetical protein [Verrucomicrobiae bacterium]